MIKQFINQVVDAISAPRTDEDDAESREAALRSATAVLMLDVARSDNVFEESEFERVLALVEKHFGMSPEDAAELVTKRRRTSFHCTNSRSCFTTTSMRARRPGSSACCGRSPTPTDGSTSMKIRSCARSATCCT